MEKRIITAPAMAKFFAGSLVLPLTLLSFSGQAFSEQDDSSIEEVMVSASLLPITASRSANAITVIDREQLKNRAAVSVGDLLRDVPGLAVNRSGVVGSVTQVRVRGAESNHLMVLVDGVEVADPSQGDEINWATISASDIERIEVIRGPQSAMRGSDAVAGVVNIITRSAEESFSSRLFTEIGTHGSHYSGVNMGVKGDSTDFMLSASHLETEGDNISRSGREKDGHQNSSYRMNGSWTVNENLRLSTAGSYIHGMNEFDSDEDFDGFVEDQDRVSGYCNSTFRAQADYLSSDGNYQHRLVVARAENINEAYADSVLGNVNSAIKDQYQYTGSVFWDGATQRLSLLLEREEEDFQQRGNITAFGNPNQDLRRDTDSAALEYRTDVSESLTFALSGRYDDNSEFDSAETFRAEAVYQLNDVARLRGAFGTAVKNPTFTERFGFFTNFIGNPDLQPEESTSWELGIDQELADGKLTVSATLFNAELENEINGFVFDADNGGFTSANTDGASQRQGVELSASGTLGDNLSLNAAYTYTDSTQPDGLGGLRDEIRRPRHTASLNLAWQATDKLHINTNAQFSGSQTDEFFGTFPSEIVSLDDYLLLNVNANYRATEKLDVYLRMENILDDDYEEVFSYQALGYGASVGLRYSF